MLSYLKSRYGPDENQYEELVETAWERLRVRPKRMKLQDWILEWKHFKEYAEELGQETTYTDLKLIRELIKICRREDLDRFATRSEDAIWVAREPGGNPAHLKLNHHIELFLKTYPMEIPKPMKGALFATLQGETLAQTSQPSHMPATAASPSSTPVPPQQEKREKTLPTCVCGEKHLYRRCPYFNRNIRPSGWKPNSKIKNQIISHLKANPEANKSLRRVLKREGISFPDWFPAEPSSTTSTNSESREDGSSHAFATRVMEESQAFAMQAFSAFEHTETNEGRPYDQSFYMDNLASHHICADITRFTNYVSTDGIMKTGDSYSSYVGIGDVKIPVVGKHEKQTFITILNVYHIPGFHINIVSARMFRRKGYVLDEYSQAIRKLDDRSLLCHMYLRDEYWTFTSDVLVPVQKGIAFATRSS
ncbi:hypothetical protein P152DRAFT_452252 [Eremomyces bilateralis CBS 781.70]|uniref:Retrovirus-related Pol polyprotein from transposon TNT 1-94-like beta-barrel domain-containing protein n=1 Tax=Eremomyces bilateralis CBS 781.70 TaxID=1392243 RepID=A0A6G1FTV6_9PEZI|nr:uncharacterized protein P152DRAFT_452252 [Eremomyces bilateralis CBS 781.70]KAF1809138.1 hypothetical protein P152DRAFT_452252 [Eremomyces bilateralis CBS 781.70]